MHGIIWSSPTYVNKEFVFYPINGSIKGGNGKKVVKLNLENGELTEYKIERSNIQYVEVIDDYIYITSNHSLVSYLTKYDMQDKQIVKEVEFEYIYANLLIAEDDRLFVFTRDMKNETPSCKMHVDNRELNSLYETPIDDYGHNSFKYLVYQDKILIQIWTDKDDNLVSRILEINLDDYALKLYEMEIPHIHELVEYEGDFIVLFSFVHDSNNSIIARLNS